LGQAANRRECGRNLACHEVVDGGGFASIWHMDNVRSASLLQDLGNHVRAGTNAVGPVGKLAWPFFRELQKPSQILYSEIL